MDLFFDEIYVPTEPVSLAEAKKHLLVDFTDDDTYITSLIQQSRNAIENYCHISITPKQVTLTRSQKIDQYPAAPYGVSKWDLSFYGYITPGNWWQLPHGPVTAVLSVTNVTDSGQITMGVLNTNYFLRGTQFKEIKTNGFCETLIVVYSTGWVNGQGAFYCPYDLKRAILEEIAFRYTNRGDQRQRYATANPGVCDGARAWAKQYIELQL